MKKGDRVKLSPIGIRIRVAGNRSIRPEDVRGTIVGQGRDGRYIPVIQWDHVKGRSTIHPDFLELDHCETP